MKKPALFLIFFFSSSCIFAQNFAENNKEQLVIAKPLSLLEAGEELHYRVEWLGVPLGGITLKNEGVRQFRGRACYYLTARAYPNKFLDNIFNIRYFVESYLDTDTLSSLQFTKTRSIGGQESRVVIDFYPRKNEAVFSVFGSSPNFKISPFRGGIEVKHPLTQKILQQTQDLLSSFYFFRLQNIKAQDSIAINIYYNQRNFPLKMSVGQPFRREIRKKGSFCVFEASPDSNINEYILGGRKFEVYLSADSKRIPIEFKLSTAIGPLHAIIEENPR